MTNTADIYSMAQVMYWFIFGTVNRGTGAEYISQKYDWDDAYIFDSIINKCLRNKPTERFQSINEIIEFYKSEKNKNKELDPFEDMYTFHSAILSVVPYYNKPSQEGIYQHYKAIATATDLPIVLYNVPGRTGVNMTAETTLRIARDFPNVIAIKEASGNITQMDDIIKNKPDNFDVISGDDGITFPLITLGGGLVFAGFGYAVPREFSRMTRLALQGDYANALTIHHRFTELFNLLFVDGNPAGVKAMLNAMGFIENRLRLPLVPTRITTYEKMRQILQTLNIKY